MNTAATRLRAARQALRTALADLLPEDLAAALATTRKTGETPPPTQEQKNRVRSAVLLAVGGAGVGSTARAAIRTYRRWLALAAASALLGGFAVVRSQPEKDEGLSRGVAEDRESSRRASRPGAPATLSGARDQQGALADHDGLPPHPLFTRFLEAPAAQSPLPDVSWAGFDAGESPLPEPEGPVFDVAAFGAVGDGTTDDTAALRAAIGAASARGGGVVYLPDGTYRLSDVLFVTGSHVVLRGQSRAGTQLLLTRSLGDVLPVDSVSAAEAPWLQVGGLVWFATFTDGGPKIG